jgi:hypothetical protein
MSIILKHEESLKTQYSSRVLFGLIAVVFGFLLLRSTPVLGLFLIVLGIVSAKTATPFIKGAVGEKKVSNILSEHSDDWYILNDIKVGNSQIDHVVVCPKGVFTIETKNHQGTIYGSDSNEEWLQIIKKKYKNKRNKTYTKSFKNYLYNPINQGRKHSYELSKYLSKCGYKVWVDTIVVFANREVTLKVSSHKVPVIYASELNHYLENKMNIVDPESCRKIADYISELDNKSPA